jgi:hypothetical protein
VRSSNKGLAVLIIALAAAFLLGLWKLYELRFSAGDIYPQYSSLRADALGAKALYESLRQIPDISTARNYREIASLPKGRSTVLFLGQNPFLFELAPEEEIKEYEALAASGARVVIAMRPVNRQREDTPKKLQPEQKPADQKKDAKKPPEAPAFEKHWGVHFGYITRPAQQTEQEPAANPKLTALYFRVDGKVLHRLERPFGSGAIVLLASCYPLSNEALAGERDTTGIAWALGSNRHVVFDEHHLGLTESGSVATLARKYHLEGLAVMLLVLLALFIWKNSTSLLPPRAESVGSEDSVAVKDANSGLANLLRRNIPARALMKTCLAEWEGSRHGAKFYSQAKIDRIRALARREGDAVETYRKISRILAERSNA